MQIERVRKWLKRAFGIAAGVSVALIGVAALSVWLLTRDDVRRLRHSVNAHPAPLPRVVANAIIAAEDPILERPRLTLRAIMPRSSRTLGCGPESIASRLTRRPLQRSSRRVGSFRLNLERAVTMFVVTQAFSSEELLRVYAHEIYLGTVDGRQILGVDAASDAYFDKTTQELSTAEAATLAAMIRAPNYYSPVRFPDRALVKRNGVLELMHRFGFIDRAQYDDAIREPLLPNRRRAGEVGASSGNVALLPLSPPIRPPNRGERGNSAKDS